MNKSQFIEKVAEKAEMSRAAAARVVDAIFDAASGAISEAVHAADGLSIPGFGKFTRKTRPARSGRNPRTGARIQVPERTTVSFSAGRTLKSPSTAKPRRARKTASASASTSSSSGGGSTRASATRRSTSSGRAASSRSSGSKSSTSSSSSSRKSGGSSSSKSGSKSGGSSTKR